MSHIPSSAMKHAGPVHHDEAKGTAPSSATRSGKQAHRTDGIGAGAWIAIGGTLLAGAAAAIAIPLLKARTTPVATRRGKKAHPRKKARKPAAA
ncbi:hypothetical protein NF700_15045 [Sphingomonadaceae bacterium OTU29MARTA1]|uniref:hypothetical protein n=1 Tax=Sphingomonas sp. Leaf37 TaxID=2876552 RepID=UPI001E4CAA98|nr:hypothetical protein [Sphingomonas sp. Leaf37]USU04729.1 hypothetical protein NF699_17080 [Sphingomonadaceae bacterium OTU29LAMAA1]USU08371.1 hypothetical protein NF700_15045 [Sphingomonadaceae bacterium OTU29MARTA1]USU11847.1 hypothetical protein NF701_15115 [Sphingomonadaceae bacterium OTU29THOMA1]